jgi:hypothetical protein
MAKVNEKREAELVSAPKDAKTASLTESSNAEEHNGINEKALLRKLDFRLLPPLTILYLLSFLDRSNGTGLPICRVTWPGC